MGLRSDFISTKSTLVLTFRNVSRTPWDGLTHPLGVHAPQLGNPCRIPSHIIIINFDERAESSLIDYICNHRYYTLRIIPCVTIRYNILKERKTLKKEQKVAMLLQKKQIQELSTSSNQPCGTQSNALL